MNKLKDILIIILVLILAACQPSGDSSYKDVKELKVASLDKGYELILVNKDYRVPDNYKMETIKLWNGVKVDKRIYPDLQVMFDDMRKVGLDPLVSWGYRTHENQKELFDNSMKKLMKKENKSLDQAYNETAKSIAIPGTSEHELGLALDINSKSKNNQAVYKWLANNAHKYGFILRYPADKVELTGVIFEPWHYRYVGKKHAKQIKKYGICLEEYVSKYK